jgi:hypothetical protein
MAFFADPIVFASLIFEGALFHTLLASPELLRICIK